ncbi:MAG: arsenate reductase ArsC [Deltaproteobacteria bacterium]|nr:arsenate reductase ArsC [Deltaproteobacteria bacterium]
MKSILFICVGNACRSQMAEGFARAYGPEDLIVYSAGSNPAGFVAREAVEFMEEKGIDISKHYSKGVSNIPIKEFDVAVTMGCGDYCPAVKTKTIIHWQIPDPFGRSQEFFREVGDDLETKVGELLKTVEKAKPVSASRTIKPRRQRPG